MAREIPELGASTPEHETSTRSIESYRIHVITPLVGGSAEPGANDTSVLVRSSSVRGHLRFWWRATRGSQIETTEELYRRESEIFGNTETPSRVKIWVTSECLPSNNSDSIMNKANATKWYLTRDIPTYVFFPYETQVREKVDVFCKRNYHFDLHIEFKDPISSDSSEISQKNLKEEVDLALCAWINFGGIGARTRRGCGALSCESFTADASTPKEFQEWFQEKFVRKYELQLHADNEEREWPTLSSRFLIGNQLKSVHFAWKDVIETYRRFRRRGNDKEVNGKIKYGRSKWPEADSIRHITGMVNGSHKIPYPDTKPKELTAFPKARFGMPIIFQFKDSNNARNAPREPYQTMLVPGGKDVDRLASPLIIKPLAVARSTAARGAFFILNQPRLQSVKLKLNANSEERNDSNYRNVEERVDRYSPLTEQAIYPNLHYTENPMGSSHDAIEAFFNSEEVVDKWPHIRNRG